MTDGSPRNNREWNPDEVMKALDMEMYVNSSDIDEDGNPISTGAAQLKGKYEDVSKRKLQEAAPLAVDRLLHIMMYTDNEPLAAKCAQYVVDRVIGRVTEKPLIGSGEDDLLRQLVTGVVSAN